MATPDRGAEALDLLARASALARHPPLGNYCALGARLLQTDALTLAERAYRAALALAPGHREAMQGLTGVLQRQGRLEEARSLLMQMAQAEPDNPHAHQRLAIMLVQLGDLEAAKQCLRAVVAKYPDFVAAWETLAELLGHRAETADEAKAILRRLSHPDQRNFRATALLGHLLARRGDPAGAKDCFIAALDIIPGNGDAMLALCHILDALGQAAQLAPIHARYVAAGGSGVIVHNSVAQALLRVGDAAGAAEAFSVALVAEPTNEEARTGLAKARAGIAASPVAAQ